MKKGFKYLINTIVFGIIYMMVTYLLTKNINWKLVIVTTMIYATFYTLIDLICNKLQSKD